MPITFKIASHEANEVHRYNPGGNSQVPDAQQVVSRVWHPDGVNCKEMLQSSYQPNENFVPNSNGFVNTVVQAYNRHHHLIIRPDDIWTSILSQMNLYINAHAEELRSKFVTHKGKKELVVTGVGNRYSTDFGKVAQIMGNLLKENIVDPSLHDWVIPNFSTTTPNDVVVCSIMMMSTLKAYFSYKSRLMCGIPSLTLLGEKDDYSSILQRIEKLAEFGEEPRFFAHLLQPILKEFCDAFDTTASGRVPNEDFWARICHYQPGGSGPSYLGGWIGAFSVWGEKGEWQGANLKDIEKPLVRNQESEESRMWGAPEPLVLGGLRYPVLDTEDIPDGFCEVDIKLDDNGEEFDCKMVAGHVGYVISAKGGRMDTLQPSSEWFMFVKGETETRAQAMERMMSQMRR